VAELLGALNPDETAEGLGAWLRAISAFHDRRDAIVAELDKKDAEHQ
jgi:hypothetical protein